MNPFSSWLQLLHFSIIPPPLLSSVCVAFVSGEFSQRAGIELWVHSYNILCHSRIMCASDNFAITPTVIQNGQYEYTLPRAVGLPCPSPESPALTLFWVRISSLSSTWSRSLNHFDCGIKASEDISLFMSRMLTTAISSKLLLSNRLGLLNRLPPSIEMVTPSTPGAFWVFSLLIMWEISCFDTVAHILSSCDTGFVGLIIHSFHPC